MAAFHLLIVTHSSEKIAPSNPRRYPLFFTGMAWVSFFINWWLFLAILGACIGGFFGLLIGFTWDPKDIGAIATAGHGLRYGAEYLGKIWGIGISIVLVFVKLMSLHRRREKILNGPHWPLF